MKGSIILCGFMGSGKTTIGKALAQISNRTFIDLDQYIEQKQGQTVSEIFRTQGEAVFRNMETQAAKELSAQADMVIATGGGTVLKAENVDFLRKNGVIVLLEVPIATIQQRLAQATDRPLLQRQDREEYMADLYSQRMPLYRAAAEVCVQADLEPQLVAHHILQQLKSKK